MTTPRKWKVFENQRNSKYGHYSNTVCLIIPTAKNNFIITPATFDTLGKPKKVVLLVDSSEGMVGIKSVTPNDPLFVNAFTVSTATHRPSSKTVATIKYISAKLFIRENNLNPGVYSSVSVENDILVVDLKTYQPLRLHI